MMLHTKYQGPRPYGFRQYFFHVLHYISLFKHVTPGAGPFWSEGYNLNNLGKALGLKVLDKKFFSCFPYISLCKTSDPRGGAIFGPRGII